MRDDTRERVRVLAYSHEKMLARFFGRHAADKSDVPDLVQEVFLKLSKAELPENLDSPRRFIISIARSVLVDNHRRRQARRVVHHTELFEGEIESTDLPIERVLDSQTITIRLQSALLELPERTRDVFALRTLREMKMAEVAKTMQISLSTAEKHHARALGHLALRLAAFRP